MVSRIAKRTGLAVVLAGVLLLAVAMAMMAAPRLFGWESLVVLSGSMEPNLQRGAIAFVEPVSQPGDVQVGDIITYRRPEGADTTVSHRVVEVVDDGRSLHFRTKGDSNSLPDQRLVPAENIVGEVRFDVPLMGYLVSWLGGSWGFVLLVAVPGVLVIGNEVQHILRNLRGDRTAAGSQGGRHVA